MSFSLPLRRKCKPNPKLRSLGKQNQEVKRWDRRGDRAQVVAGGGAEGKRESVKEVAYPRIQEESWKWAMEAEWGRMG